jgi:nucleoside-diphosphate-sugar epimerase
MDLTVAVTGPTGTFGHGLLPLLEHDDRVAKVVGIARRPFDPAAAGWHKMTYQQGDVRDQEGLSQAFAGADVVVHLAFIIVGGEREATRAINIEGTLNAFRAAAAAGVRRFVYASSVAAYGFHADNPMDMREDWPVRPADRLFYAQQKAELELLLQDEASANPDVELYLLRPSIVVGPNALGGKELPGPVAFLGRLIGLRRTPVRLPLLVPELPLQLVHEDDVGQALLLCIVGAGPAAPYNIAGDGIVTAVDVARELGFLPVAMSARPAQLAARTLAKLPYLPTFAEWVEAFSTPSVMDTSRAKEQLGWEPRWTGLEALRDTLVSGRSTDPGPTPD